MPPLTTVPDGLSRRARDRLRHRGEILAAARRVIEDKGLAGLTIEEVARRAEFAVGSIYRHFRSKDELVEHLMLAVSEPICADAEAVAAAGGPFEDQLQNMVRGLYLHLVEDLPLFKALHAAGPFGAEVSERLIETRLRFVRAMERVMAAGQAEGVLRDDDPRVLAVTLLGSVSGLVRWSFALPAELDAPTVLCRQFLDGARRR